MLTPVLAGAQNMNSTGLQSQSPSPTPTGFINLANTTLYNESSASSSTMTFNSNGTYTRTLHGNVLDGLWTSHIIIAQEIRICPGESKWMNDCILAILKSDSPNSAVFTDKHLDRLILQR